MTHHTLDHLIERIAANEATRAEFDSFTEAAREHPAAWERLARSLRDELQLREALDETLSTDVGAELHRAQSRSRRRRISIPRTFSRTWSGWAVAAMVAVAASIVWFTLPAPTQEATPEVQPIGFAIDPDEALEQYLALGQADGRVLAELPTVLIDYTRLDGGRYEVMYLRQFLEREEVNELYELAPDEHGLPTPVPYEEFALPTGGSASM